MRRTSGAPAFHRRRFLALAGGGTAALGSLLFLPSSAEAAWPKLRDGDVFLTRNPRNNMVPGYWNHAALYASGLVYEAQVNPGIRTVPFNVFYGTYPRIAVLRLNAQYLVPRMLWYARSLVGKPYTVLPVHGGYTCVFYVRVSYYFATLAYAPTDPGWIIPDHIAADRRLISVGSK